MRTVTLLVLTLLCASCGTAPAGAQGLSSSEAAHRLQNDAELVARARRLHSFTTEDARWHWFINIVYPYTTQHPRRYLPLFHDIPDGEPPVIQSEAIASIIKWDLTGTARRQQSLQRDVTHFWSRATPVRRTRLRLSRRFLLEVVGAPEEPMQAYFGTGQLSDFADAPAAVELYSLAGTNVDELVDEPDVRNAVQQVAQRIIEERRWQILIQSIDRYGGMCGQRPEGWHAQADCDAWATLKPEYIALWDRLDSIEAQLLESAKPGSPRVPQEIVNALDSAERARSTLLRRFCVEVGHWPEDSLFLDLFAPAAEQLTVPEPDL